MFIMFGLFVPHHGLTSHRINGHHTYFQDLLNSTHDSTVMCYDHECMEGETCCQSIDYGTAFCCTEMSGFMYLGVMVGGGIFVALLFICCYVVLRGKEKQMEAAAQLETAKAVSTAISSAHEAIQLAGEAGSHGSEDVHSGYNAPPPSYGDVVLTLQRSQSHDVTRSANPDDDVTSGVNRQLSEGSRLPAGTNTALFEYPQLPRCTSLESKLPTYEQCTSSPGEYVMRGANYAPCASPNTNMLASYSMPRGENLSQTNRSEHQLSESIKCTESNHSMTSSTPGVRRMPLTTPTQVDDDTGIIEPRPHVVILEETAMEENQDATSPSPSRVRCRLEFRWNPYNSHSQSEIAIGFKGKATSEGDDDEETSSTNTTTSCNSGADTEKDSSVTSDDPRVGNNTSTTSTSTSTTTSKDRRCPAEKTKLTHRGFFSRLQNRALFRDVDDSRAGASVNGDSRVDTIQNGAGFSVQVVRYEYVRN